MGIIRTIVKDDLTDYLDTLVDGEVILNRSDAVRQVIIDHRDKIKKAVK